MNVLRMLLLVALLMMSTSASAEKGRADDLKAEDLPVSLERIQRKLAQAPPSPAGSALKIQYYVEVYGRAPTIDLFANFDLEKGPVPYGGPTHSDFLQLVTPQEFRSPPADFAALAAWLVQRLGKKR